MLPVEVFIFSTCKAVIPDRIDQVWLWPMHSERGNSVTLSKLPFIAYGPPSMRIT